MESHNSTTDQKRTEIEVITHGQRGATQGGQGRVKTERERKTGPGGYAFISVHGWSDWGSQAKAR